MYLSWSQIKLNLHIYKCARSPPSLTHTYMHKSMHCPNIGLGQGRYFYGDNILFLKIEFLIKSLSSPGHSYCLPTLKLPSHQITHKLKGFIFYEKSSIKSLVYCDPIDDIFKTLTPRTKSSPNLIMHLPSWFP